MDLDTISLLTEFAQRKEGYSVSHEISAPSLEQIAAGIRIRLEQSHRAREEALKLCREVIQFSSRTIRAIHRE